MTRSLSELAAESLLVQDACNMGGVSYGFRAAMRDLGEHGLDTRERNRHPITVAWASKIADLAGIAHDPETWNGLEDRIKALIDGGGND